MVFFGHQKDGKYCTCFSYLKRISLLLHSAAGDGTLDLPSLYVATVASFSLRLLRLLNLKNILDVLQSDIVTQL